MLLALLLAAAQTPAEHPSVRLGVAGGSLTLFLPHPERGFYRGTRFAHSGVIKDLEVGGFKLFGAWKDTHNPSHADDITGPAEEFGMFDPLGFADAKVGDRFVKIGVGELVRGRDEAYQFQGKFERGEAGRWQVEREPEGDANTVTLTHVLNSKTGFGYRYTKAVKLQPAAGGGVELALGYSLTNTGQKPIRTDVYNHNFFNVDGQPVGPKYRVEFPRPVKPTPASKFGEAAVFDGAAYTFRRPLAAGESAFGWLEDSDGRPLPHAYTLLYRAGTGKTLTVRAASETPVTKFQTWSVPTCLCPEPFSAINVPAGSTQTWATRYTIRAE